MTKSAENCGFGHILNFLTFTEEILNGKLHFLNSVSQKKSHTFRNHRRLYVNRYSREKYEQGRIHQSEDSIDLLDHIKPSLRKATRQIIIHAGTNDISNNTNYLKKDKKIVKLVKESYKDTKLTFSSVICCTDIKNISDTINTTNSHLENYWN